MEMVEITMYSHGEQEKVLIPQCLLEEPLYDLAMASLLFKKEGQ